MSRSIDLTIEELSMTFACSASLCAALVIFAIQPTVAQDDRNITKQGRPGASASTISPYAGMQKRHVKALSEQQIADLRAGRGMGLSLVAELNGYPGPLHVLDLADGLELSDVQQTRTKTLLEAMKAETIPIGERVIDEETAFDRLFAEKRVTPASLEAAAARIAAAQGELRAAHLRYHLAMADVLSSAQIARYAELRGYSESGHHVHGSH
jgi:hypothetical protein